MSRQTHLNPVFVDAIPARLDDGSLYISRKYQTAVHRCCCGCGNEVVTPLKPANWRLTDDNGLVSLHPSIGNWSFPCQSHYWIVRNDVRWSGRLTEREIAAVRMKDRVDNQRHLTPVPKVEVPAAKSAPQPNGGFWAWLRRWLGW